MPEGLEQARDAFANEIAPASRPRDQAGRFVATSRAPEPMFQPRPVEGDPATGDNSDGGPDPRFVDQERRIADGRSEERDEDRGRRAAQDNAARSRGADDDEGGDEAAAGKPERVGAQEADDAGPDAERRGEGPEAPSEVDEGPTYEVTIDGAPVEVTVQELSRAYQRDRQFNERVNRLAQAAQATDQEMSRATQVRDHYLTQLQQHEAEFQAILPPEPNWDELFRTDPKGAHELQKNYQQVYGKLNAIRQQRAQAQADAQADYERRTAEYARNGFNEFVSRARIKDEKELKYEIDSMRRTALADGFSEHEIATVYDPRMLRILQKASKYDRMMANAPKPVIPGKGKTLTPGVAPRIGNSTRRGFDDAQAQLQKSGRLEDAEAVFARMLR